jgi:hypothetical protein
LRWRTFNRHMKRAAKAERPLGGHLAARLPARTESRPQVKGLKRRGGLVDARPIRAIRIEALQQVLRHPRTLL